MKKKKTPEYEELIDRLTEQALKRNPERRKFAEQIKISLYEAWLDKPINNLATLVKNLEINAKKAEIEIEKHEERVVEFQTGVDILGFPVYCVHQVVFKPEGFKNPKRYSKKGSKLVEPTNTYAWKQWFVKQH